MRRVAVLALGLLVAAAAPAHAGADPAAQALTACLEADDMPGDKIDRLPVLENGAALAEAAIGVNPRDPRGHIALVCNLGKALEVSGISWRSLQRLNRLKAALEAGLAVAPDDPDLLTSKGVVLRKLPSMLGGDPVEGEKYLRRAVAARPDNCAAHRFLAEALADRDLVAARAEAARALAAAQQTREPRDVAAAQALVTRLR